MTKRKPETPTAKRVPEAPRNPARTVELQEHIGRELKAMFEDVVAEPVPENLQQLLEELERKQSKG